MLNTDVTSIGLASERDVTVPGTATAFGITENLVAHENGFGDGKTVYAFDDLRFRQAAIDLVKSAVYTSEPVIVGGLDFVTDTNLFFFTVQIRAKLLHLNYWSDGSCRTIDRLREQSGATELTLWVEGYKLYISFVFEDCVTINRTDSKPTLDDFENSVYDNHAVYSDEYFDHVNGLGNATDGLPIERRTHDTKLTLFANPRYTLPRIAIQAAQGDLPGPESCERFNVAFENAHVVSDNQIDNHRFMFLYFPDVEQYVIYRWYYVRSWDEWQLRDKPLIYKRKVSALNRYQGFLEVYGFANSPLIILDLEGTLA